MFSGGQRAITPEFRVKDQQLTVRPYNAALTSLTETICAEVGQSGQDACLFETRTAFDCLLRHKVRKYGDISDNIGECSHHISNMKQALGDKHSKYLDSKLEELHYMRKSFV